MEREVLKQEYLDKIKSEPMLYGKVCAELKISPASLPRLIYDRDNRLTQVGVLNILCDHLKVASKDDLLETILESDDNNNTVEPIMQEVTER